MPKIRHATKLSILLCLLSTSCDNRQPISSDINKDITNINQSDKSNNFTTKALEKGIQPKDQPADLISPSFDEIPSYSEKNIVPGIINIIYRNDQLMRVSKDGKNLTSSIIESSNAVNAILNKHGIKSMADRALLNESDEELDQKQRKIAQISTTEIPHLRSVHTYYFPDNADTMTISEELRKLPFVRTAYPGIQGDTASLGLVAGQTINNVRYQGTIPGDPGFNNTDPFFDENKSWYLYNNHKVFQAWNLYRTFVGGSNINNAPKPKIAVVDSGFDTGFIGDDRPNYTLGVSIGDGNLTTAQYDNSSMAYTFQLPTDPIGSGSDINVTSHGARMSSLLASPTNNYGLCGVLPGAPIYPVKVILNENSFANGIRLAANSGSKVISASLALKNANNLQIPISFSPLIGIEILYATYSSDIPCVIAAGNYKVNLDIPSNRNYKDKYGNVQSACSNYPTCQDKGQVIVGGTDNKGLLWNYTNEFGSNYGKAVTISAYSGAGEYNYASTFNPIDSNPSGTYHLFPGTGTSDSAPLVAGTIAMMKQIGISTGYNYTAAQLRDLVAYTATLSRSTSGTASETKFAGLKLSDTSINTNSLAGIRDLNMYNAVALVGYSSQYNIITRIYNVDDSTQGSVNSNWTSPYATEPFFNDRFFGDVTNSSTNTSFRTNNISGNGSFGYQVYRYGLLKSEKLLGVVTRYNTSKNDYQNYPLFTTVGVPTTGYFSQSLWNYNVP